MNLTAKAGKLLDGAHARLMNLLTNLPTVTPLALRLRCHFMGGDSLGRRQRVHQALALWIR